MEFKSAAFFTLGCKLNQAETALLQNSFQQNNVMVKPFGEPVDLTVINTCTVTSAADRDCRNAVRRAKRASPHGKIAVVGCCAELKPEALKNEGADYIFGTTNKEALLELLFPLGPSIPSSPLSPSRTRTLLKIQDGCNNFCSYCIVPYARGRSRSEPFEKIVREVEELVTLNAPEIVLTGVNIGDYFDQGKTLLDLLKTLARIPGLQRLRLSSIEPHTVTPELIELMGTQDNICPHLHIPLQSGNDKQLREMHRPYATDDYARLLKTIVQKIPAVGIGTDLIVGFPGESDEDFERTLQFVSEQPLSYLHVFSYSVRLGTAAENLPDQVPAHIIKQRTRRLIELGEKKKKEFAERFVGREMAVLFDQYRNGIASGYTMNYIRVSMRSDVDLRKEVTWKALTVDSLQLRAYSKKL